MKTKLIFFKLLSVKDALINMVIAKVWFIEGLHGTGAVPLKIIFSGSKLQKCYLCKMLFESKCKEVFAGKKFFWQVLSLIRRNDAQCDVAIVEGNFFHKQIYRHFADFFSPVWLQGLANIPLQSTNHSTKNDLRKIHKFGLTYVIGNSKNQLDDFYYHMYLPYIQMRHQESAVPMKYQEMVNKVRTGTSELLLINKGETAIAGIVYHIKDEIPRLWSTGIRDGDLTNWNEGAMAACYFFCSEHLAQLGFKQMNMGLMRSFLDDGILQYKKRRGVSVSSAFGSKIFMLKALIPSSGRDSFFLEHPFIFDVHHHLNGAIFTRDNQHLSDKELGSLIDAYALNGVEALNFYNLQEWTSPPLHVPLT